MKMKLLKICIIIGLFFIFFSNGSNRYESVVTNNSYESGNIESIKDLNLRKCVSDALPDGQELSSILDIVCDYRMITHLDGIEELSNLKTISLKGNYIYDANALNNIPSLTSIALDRNYIESINLSSLSNLKQIGLHANRIDSVTDLKLPTSLEILSIGENYLSGLVDLSNLSNLKTLYIPTNAGITSIKVADVNKIENIDISDLSIETTDNVYDASKKLSSVSNQLNSLAVNGMELNDNLKQFILANASSLNNLQIGRTGITDISFLDDNASLFSNLKILNLGVNNLGALDLSNFNKLETLYLDSCDLERLVLADKSIVKELYLGNNKFTSFDGSGYTSLTYLDLHQNPLSSYNFTSNTNLIYLDLSFIDLSNKLDLSKLSSNINTLKLISTKLSGNLDFSSLSSLRKLYIYNEDYRGSGLENTYTSVKINPNLNELNTNNNTNLTAFNVDGTSNLETLDIVASKISSIDFTKYPKLKHLGVASTNNLTTLDLTPVKNTISAITMNSSALVNSYTLPTDLPALTYLGINATQVKNIDFSKYPSLGILNIGYYDDIYYISSNNKINIDDIIKMSMPSGITISNNYLLFQGFSATENFNRKDELLLDSNNYMRFHLVDSSPKIDSINYDTFRGVIDYSAYYTVRGVLLGSDKYTFDEGYGAIIVGNDNPDSILANITISNSDATKEIKDGYLIIKIGNTEKRYRLAKDMNDLIPGGNSKGSVDPVVKNTSTTDNPKTGIIISFVGTLFLLIVGLSFAYYYQYNRRKKAIIEKL